MINCLPVMSRNRNEHSNHNPEVGARCRQAVTSLQRSVKNMKKLIAAALITISICVVALIVSSQSGTTTHPIEAVVAAINAGAKSSGTTVMEQRSVSGRLRGGRIRPITNWIGDTTGRETFDDITEFLVRGAAGDIRITVYHRDGDAAEIEIAADAHLSSTASTIKREILSALPGIRCSVDSP